MIPMISESGTSAPLSMYPLASLPSAVPAATAERRMSPVEIWTEPSWALSILATVPLPAPGAPRRITRMFRASLNEVSTCPAPNRHGAA